MILPAACVLLFWERPVFVAVLVPIFLAGFALEWLAPWRAQRRLRPGWNTDVFHAILTRAVALYVGIDVCLAVAASSIDAALPGLVRTLVSQPVWARVVEALLAGDLLVYGQHRLVHRVPALWRIHRIHHIGADLDVLSRFRYHIAEYWLFVCCQALPLAVLHVPLWLDPFVISAAYHVGTLAHVNTRIGFGPLGWLLVTPGYHRRHHLDAQPRRNFAEVFPVWDLVLGTADRRRVEPGETLGSGDNQPVAYADQLAAPFTGRNVPEEAA